MQTGGNDGEFHDTNNPSTTELEMVKAIKNILEEMAECSSEQKQELLNKIRDTVDQIDINGLNIALDSQGLNTITNRKEFMGLIEKGLENLKPEDVKPDFIQNILKSANKKALTNSINKGPLDKLSDNFKTLSTNKKIATISAGAAVTAIFSPLIALAALIALTSIGVRYTGIGAKKAGEGIKEGAKISGKFIKEKSVEAGKAIKGGVKNIIDTALPTIEKRKSNFDKFSEELDRYIIDIAKSPPTSKDDETKITDSLLDMKEIVKMLQNKEQQSAIKELVKNEDIKDFSEDDMKRLIKKGSSTHQVDEREVEKLMEALQPKIMEMGNGKRDEVRQIVDKKVDEMKPKTGLDTVETQHTGQKKSGPTILGG